MRQCGEDGAITHKEPSMALLTSKGQVPDSELAKYAERSKRAKPANTYRIQHADGGVGHYTQGQLAEMAGISDTSLSKRLRKAQQEDGPVTLAKLGIDG